MAVPPMCVCVFNFVACFCETDWLRIVCVDCVACVVLRCFCVLCVGVDVFLCCLACIFLSYVYVILSCNRTRWTGKTLDRRSALCKKYFIEAKPMR